MKTKTSFKSGERHPRWKGGRYSHMRGYIFVLSPNHPFKNIQGYVLEHRLVIEKSLGRFIEPHERVHHLDGNPSNNALENLVLFSNQSKHIKNHNHSRNSLGQFI